MSTSTTAIRYRLAAFTVAAATLPLAFGGAAFAAAPPSSCGAQHCDFAAPDTVGRPQPEADPAPPTEVHPEEPPTEPSVHPEPQPTTPEPAEPVRPAGLETVDTPPAESPSAGPPTGGPDTGADASSEQPDRDGVFATMLAGLAALVLGGGWLGSAISRKLRGGR